MSATCRSCGAPILWAITERVHGSPFCYLRDVRVVRPAAVAIAEALGPLVPSLEWPATGREGT